MLETTKKISSIIIAIISGIIAIDFGVAKSG